MVLWDERLTTVAAERVLMESGVRRAQKGICGSDRSCHDLTGIFRPHGDGTEKRKKQPVICRRAENKMEERTDCITMVTEDGDEVVFSVLEETRIHGKDYLLVTDAPEDEDGECYILKDVSGEQEPDAVYEFVEDDRELDSVMGIFEALLSDADVEIEK